VFSSFIVYYEEIKFKYLLFDICGFGLYMCMRIKLFSAKGICFQITAGRNGVDTYWDCNDEYEKLTYFGI